MYDSAATPTAFANAAAQTFVILPNATLIINDAASHTTTISWKAAFLAILFIIAYIYVAIKDYKNWRRLHGAFFANVSEQKGTVLPEIKRNALIYIPFLPFAFVYLSLRVAWDVFKLFVFYSLDSAEQGVYLLWRFIVWASEVIPDLISAVPPLIVKNLEAFFEWASVYVFPVVEKVSIVLYRVSIRLIVDGKDAAIVTWKKSVEWSKTLWEEIGYPLAQFLLSVAILSIEPGKWLVSRTIYLGRIAWYCACFLARDLAEDAQHLFIFGWKVGKFVLKNVLVPVKEVVEKLATDGWQKVKLYGPVVGQFLYRRMMVTTVAEITWIFYGICGDPLFRMCAKKVYDFVAGWDLLLADIKRMIEVFLPPVIRNIRRAGLGTIESTYRTCLDFILFMRWFHYTIILPVARAIPVGHARAKIIYARIKSIALSTVRTLWTVFGPLIRPVLVALGIFYTTVILAIILACFRAAKVATTYAVNAGIKLSTIFKGILFATFDVTYVFYQSMIPHISNVLYALKKSAYSVGDVLVAHFPKAVAIIAGFLNALLKAINEYSRDAYVKYEPVIVSAKEQVVQAADAIVFGIGQAMMDWAKKEQELRRSG